MTQRITLTDEMVNIIYCHCFGAELVATVISDSRKAAILSGLKVALNKFRERRKSERRGLQSGAYAPSGPPGHWHMRLGDPSATLHRRGQGDGNNCFQTWRGQWLHRRKNDSDEALKPHRRATDEAKGDATTEKAAGAAVELPPLTTRQPSGALDVYAPYRLHRRDVDVGKPSTAHRRASDPTPTGVTGGAPAQPKQDAVEDWTPHRRVNDGWSAHSHRHRRDRNPTVGTTADTTQPPQASTRPSASTTTPSQAPEVSEAMIEAGQKAWSDHPGMSVQKALPAIYRSMELKRRQERKEARCHLCGSTYWTDAGHPCGVMREENNWDGTGPGGA